MPYQNTATRPIVVPPLPDGFVLDGLLPEGYLPPLPEGFALGEQEPAAASTGEDVARSAASALANGAAGIPSAAGDAHAALKRSGLDEWLTKKFTDWFPNYVKWVADYAAQHHGYALAGPDAGVKAGAAVLRALPDGGTSQRVRIDDAISALTGAATGALGFHLGGTTHFADSAMWHSIAVACDA